MKIRNLSLSWYKGFQYLELEFNEKVNVIAGVNGVGKSSVLQALRVLYSRVLADVAFEKIKINSFEDSDVYNQAPSLGVTSEFEISKSVAQAGIQRNTTTQEKRDEWTEKLNHAEEQMRDARQQGDSSSVVLWRLESQKYRGFLNNVNDKYIRAFKNLTLPKDQLDGVDYVQIGTRELLSKLRKNENQSFVVYYSPLRHIFSRVRTLPEGEPLGIEKAFAGALEETETDFRSFMHWFRWLEQSDDKTTKRKRNVILKSLRGAVTTFIPEFKNLRLEEQPKLRLLVDKNGTPLELAQLSDGERGLLTLVFDLTRRLALVNPTLANPIAQGQSVVLIDELELHLHPTWQRQVLRRLSSTFPNCQFIVTTHSPQVIGQVKPESLHLLHRDSDNRITVKKAAQSFGMDSNWVLQEVMGTTARDFDTEQKLAAIYDAIDEDNLVLARALAVALEQEIGLFPDLQGAKSLMDRLEMLAEDDE